MDDKEIIEILFKENYITEEDVEGVERDAKSGDGSVVELLSPKLQA